MVSFGGSLEEFPGEEGQLLVDVVGLVFLSRWPCKMQPK